MARGVNDFSRQHSVDVSPLFPGFKTCTGREEICFLCCIHVDSDRRQIDNTFWAAQEKRYVDVVLFTKNASSDFTVLLSSTKIMSGLAHTVRLNLYE